MCCEDNAKDGTIKGRNCLRQDYVMKVENVSYESYLAALEEWKEKELGLSLEDQQDFLYPQLPANG